MILPTEPIGSIPRPLWLIEAVTAAGGPNPALEPLYEEAVRDTVAQMDMAKPWAEPGHVRRRAVMVLARPESAVPHRHVVAPIADRVLSQDPGHAMTSRPGTTLGF